MSLIASVLSLKRADIRALRITDLYSWHRVVYGLYPDVRDDATKLASASSGILWADHGGNFHQRKILLLADRMPQSQAEGGYGEVISKPISDQFLTHSHYRFTVIINPTLRDSASGKRLPIKGRENVAQWFMQRAPTAWGFCVDNKTLQVERINVQQFIAKAQQTITLSQATVTGQLQVTDRVRFEHSFAQGIGRGRSFGCGLLQIAPISENPFA
ncbi:type I-E CRISPR-associated protein Cas6/Cse3/CasE [Sinimarinibacterium sp. NLF-5-8]|uniref:type I-E CRISPR-associated protein Cas6/Cse3/CasE n=1 Tax=Sinimarinibacterium sp. NLF-5-8 TaxID=2698684 RepID=UPI00137BEDF0|nr:type I-E CRISPR-associated protein Cas6/Cse3/CasE [Sinimarinibacterium sp. NLF-5-8]QHS10719.1 type I-E CRISPR-associated protein Cas6/Cse3/CasE [Sinimarinibacterium sp. NLF-5-8]